MGVSWAVLEAFGIDSESTKEQELAFSRGANAECEKHQNMAKNTDRTRYIRLVPFPATFHLLRRINTALRRRHVDAATQFEG